MIPIREALALSLLLQHYRAKAETDNDLNIAAAFEDLLDGEDAQHVLVRVIIRAAECLAVVGHERSLDIAQLANVCAEHVHEAIARAPAPPLKPRLVVNNDGTGEVKFQ